MRKVLSPPAAERDPLEPARRGAGDRYLQEHGGTLLCPVRSPAASQQEFQVERWFGLITQQAIRRDSFRSVRDLIRKIDSYVTHYNAASRPFIWTAAADSIFAKLQGLCKVVNGTSH